MVDVLTVDVGAMPKLVCGPIYVGIFLEATRRDGQFDYSNRIGDGW